MVIQDSSITFGPHSGSGQELTTIVTMPAVVTQATAILTGFNSQFSGNHDHHLGMLNIEVDVPPGGISGLDVEVKVTFGLRDWTGTWDDEYEGNVFFTVIGE
jgi:hypothetical protein